MRQPALRWYAPRYTLARSEEERRRPGKELLAGIAEPETLLRLGDRVGGVRRAARLGRGAGGTNGAHKPARVRARLGPGSNLRRRLDRASALRPLWPRRWLADGPFRPQAPYALRARPYRLEHLDGRGDDRAVAAQPVLGGT